MSSVAPRGQPDSSDGALRIAFAATGGTVGGAERVLLDAIEGIRASRPSWALSLVTPAGGPLADDARALGAEVQVVPFPSVLARLGDSPVGRAKGRAAWAAGLASRLLLAAPSTLLYLARLRRHLVRLGPDVLHTNGFKMHLLGALAAPRGTRLVWHLHDYVAIRPVMAAALRMCARRVDAVAANSASVAEDVRAVCRGRVPVRTVYNGVDLERYSPDGPTVDLDALSGLSPAPPGTVRTGLVGTMARWKGHQVFLRALARLPRELPVRGYVVGGALYQTARSQHDVEELRALAASLGIGDRVGFAGYQRDTAPAMRALDIVVHASTLPEPFGLVIAEAMACGRPVIVSDAGGAREIVSGCDCALSHPPGDAGALAAAVQRLARDGTLRATMGRAGRAAAERRFDRARAARQLEQLYMDVTRRN